MKQLTCSDLGGMDCNFKATGQTADEVKQKMFAHAEQAHADMLKSMTPQQMQGLQQRMEQLLA
jgi:predicted small metal-binding protein